MEVPSPVITGLFYYHTFDRLSLPQHAFAIMWLVHYIHRAGIYPLLQAGADKPMTLITVLSSSALRLRCGCIFLTSICAHSA